MNIMRVYAVVLRHKLGWTRKYDQWLELFYWPVLDLVLWGVTTVWLVKSQEEHSGKYFLLALMSAVVLWQLVWRANQEIGINFLEEVWNKNVVNLFASPLTIAEWVVGLLVVSLVKIFLALAIGVGTAYLLYALKLFEHGLELLPFLAVVVLFGWTVGFVAVALILRFGRQIMNVAWTLCALFGPLSAVYFPVASLPDWLKPVAAAIPTSYVFEGVRTVMSNGEVNYSDLILAYGLGVTYFAAALLLFQAAFRFRVQKGLQSMEG